MKSKISITLDRKLLKHIDEKRGITDRSSFIEMMLKRGLGWNRR